MWPVSLVGDIRMSDTPPVGRDREMRLAVGSARGGGVHRQEGIQSHDGRGSERHLVLSPQVCFCHLSSSRIVTLSVPQGGSLWLWGAKSSFAMPACNLVADAPKGLSISVSKVKGSGTKGLWGGQGWPGDGGR